jgi:hypothetical protein
MPFDPVSWAIGFVLTTSLKKHAEKLLQNSDLPSKLWRTVELWADTLPAEMRFNPYALFEKLTDESGDSPAVKKLGAVLAKGIVPSSQIWFNALMERWKKVRKRLGNDANAFFLLEENEAALKLRDLADQLTRTCQEDATLFQITVLSLLDANTADPRILGGIQFHISKTDVEALGYSPTQAKIHFTLSNLTGNLIKITHLDLRVLNRESIRRFRLPQWGAPIKEFSLFADLTQGDCSNLLAHTNVQFVLDHKDSDAFEVTAQGEEGYKYTVTIECKAVSLSTSEVYDLTTDHISIIYPIRTPRGIKRHQHEFS